MLAIAKLPGFKLTGQVASSEQMRYRSHRIRFGASSKLSDMSTSRSVYLAGNLREVVGGRIADQLNS